MEGPLPGEQMSRTIVSITDVRLSDDEEDEEEASGRREASASLRPSQQGGSDCERDPGHRRPRSPQPSPAINIEPSDPPPRDREPSPPRLSPAAPRAPESRPEQRASDSVADTLPPDPAREAGAMPDAAARPAAAAAAAAAAARRPRGQPPSPPLEGGKVRRAVDGLVGRCVNVGTPQLHGKWSAHKVRIHWGNGERSVGLWGVMKGLRPSEVSVLEREEEVEEAAAEAADGVEEEEEGEGETEEERVVTEIDGSSSDEEQPQEQPQEQPRLGPRSSRGGSSAAGRAGTATGRAGMAVARPRSAAPRGASTVKPGAISARSRRDLGATSGGGASPATIGHGVTIEKSGLLDAGLGLFAGRCFRVGECITEYVSRSRLS